MPNLKGRDLKVCKFKNGLVENKLRISEWQSILFYRFSCTFFIYVFIKGIKKLPACFIPLENPSSLVSKCLYCLVDI